MAFNIFGARSGVHVTETVSAISIQNKLFVDLYTFAVITMHPIMYAIIKINSIIISKI